jgi:hypothetical protein
VYEIALPFLFDRGSDIQAWFEGLSLSLWETMRNTKEKIWKSKRK